jgi:hypothetical protein
MANTEQKQNTYHIAYDREKKTLNGVPLWMLFIDKDCHSKGEMFFDLATKEGDGVGEPGYNAAMTSAFDYMLTNLDKKLNAEEFQHLHYLCVSTVENVKSNNRDFQPGIYGIKIDKISAAAKCEWESERLITTPAKLFELLTANPGADDGYLSFQVFLNRHAITSRYMSGDGKLQDATLAIITKKINDCFQDYYTRIKDAKDDIEKLSMIVSLCRKLEIGHYFPDGNQRTIVFLILNKLLIENGFSPVILDDPSVFDGYHSKNELVQDVKTGIEYFLSLTKAPAKDAKNKTGISSVAGPGSLFYSQGNKPSQVVTPETAAHTSENTI